MYQFRGREWYREMHEREWDPSFEDRGEVEQDEDEEEGEEGEED
jgi:tRNA(His) 5'-end guanylyltransferase